jgi:hypothetical protein
MEQPIEACPAMRAHRNSVRLHVLGTAHDLRGGIPDAHPPLHRYTTRRQSPRLLL